MDWIKFLETYSGAFSFFATAILAVLTLLTVRIASKTLKEMRQTREDESRPYVVFYISKLNLESKHYYMIIENFGKTAAQDVTVSTSPALSSLTESTLSDYKIYLAPGQKILAYFDREKNESVFDCCVSYSGENGQYYSASYQIDLNFSGAVTWLEPKDYTAEELKKLNKTLQEFVRMQQ